MKEMVQWSELAMDFERLRLERDGLVEENKLLRQAVFGAIAYNGMRNGLTNEEEAISLFLSLGGEPTSQKKGMRQ
jgi:hypothetical protein